MDSDFQSAVAIDFLGTLEKTKNMSFDDAYAQYGEAYLMTIPAKNDVVLHERAKQTSFYRDRVLIPVWQHLIKACSPIVFYEFDLLTKDPDQSLITIWKGVYPNRAIALDLAWLADKDRHTEIIDSIYNHKSKSTGKWMLQMIIVTAMAFRSSTPAYDKICTYAQKKRELLEKSLLFWVKSSPRSLQDIAMTQVVLGHNISKLPHVLRDKYSYYSANQGQVCDITYVNACEPYIVSDTSLEILNKPKKNGYRIKCRGCFSDCVIVRKKGKRVIMCEYASRYRGEGLLANFSGDKPSVIIHKRIVHWSTIAHGAMFL